MFSFFLLYASGTIEHLFLNAPELSRALLKSNANYKHRRYKKLAKKKLHPLHYKCRQTAEDHQHILGLWHPHKQSGIKRIAIITYRLPVVCMQGNEKRSVQV